MRKQTEPGNLFIFLEEFTVMCEKLSNSHKNIDGIQSSDGL